MYFGRNKYKYKTSIDYSGGLEKLVIDLGELRYDILAKFFRVFT